jgi:hypothetical protein
MKDLKEKNKYEGQALAITMVVLVVSALIGLSIYSRAMKDRMLTLEERASAEALEISDVTLERLNTLPIGQVVSAVEEVAQGTGGNVEDGIVLKEGGESRAVAITELFNKLNITGGGSSISDLLAPICPIGTGGNEYQLTLKAADENTFYEVRAGHVWSLPAREILRGKSDCSLNMNFSIRGDSRAGFVVTKIFCNYGANGIATDCDDYKVNQGHVEKYCFADGLECNNPNFQDDANWGKFNPDRDNLGTIMMSGSTAPSEIRITAVGGTVGISYYLPEGCMDGLRMYQLRATANCGGVYRGKEILIPERQWHESIFDYVIFNNEGSI